MTLLFCDSFDTYGDTDGTAPSPVGIPDAKYDYTRYTNQLRALTTYNLACMHVWHEGYAVYMHRENLTTNSTLIAGIRRTHYQSRQSKGSVRWPILVFMTGTTICLQLIFANGTFRVLDADGDFIGAAKINIAGYNAGGRTSGDNWHYLEMKAYCHDTAGTVEVRLNGAPIIQLANVKTKFGTNAYFDRCGIGRNVSQAYAGYASRWRDFYICDGAGTKNNDFLGAVKVDTLFPDGDDNVNFATTGNANYATHYQQVNIVDAKWTTDYIEDSIATTRDIFTVGDTENFATIHGVAGVTVAEGITANQNYKQVISSNGTESLSANLSANTSVNKSSVFILEDDPDTSSAWTPATVNAAKFGIELQ